MIARKTRISIIHTFTSCRVSNDQLIIIWWMPCSWFRWFFNNQSFQFSERATHAFKLYRFEFSICLVFIANNGCHFRRVEQANQEMKRSKRIEIVLVEWIYWTQSADRASHPRKIDWESKKIKQGKMLMMIDDYIKDRHKNNPSKFKL